MTWIFIGLLIFGAGCACFLKRTVRAADREAKEKGHIRD